MANIISQKQVHISGVFICSREIFHTYKLHDIEGYTHDAKTVSRITYFTKYQGDFECSWSSPYLPLLV